MASETRSAKNGLIVLTVLRTNSVWKGLSPNLLARYELRIHFTYHFIDAHDVRPRHTNHSNTLSTQRTQTPFRRTLQGTQIRSRKECLRL